MTWKEFKAAVEACGVKDDDAIDFIDCSNYLPTLTVERNERGDAWMIWE